MRAIQIGVRNKICDLGKKIAPGKVQQKLGKEIVVGKPYLEHKIDQSQLLKTISKRFLAIYVLSVCKSIHNINVSMSNLMMLMGIFFCRCIMF